MQHAFIEVGETDRLFNSDQNFDRRICNQSGLKGIRVNLQSTRSQLDRARHAELLVFPILVKLREEIVCSIRNGDAEAEEFAMRRHLRRISGRPSETKAGAPNIFGDDEQFERQARLWIMNGITILASGRRSIVGESPVWNLDAGTLIRGDIIGKRVFWFELASGKLFAPETENFPTADGLCRAPGKVVAAFARGVSLWYVGTDRFEPLVRLDEELDGNRLNESAASPDGDFRVGTMRELGRSSAALHFVRTEPRVG